MYLSREQRLAALIQKTLGADLKADGFTVGEGGRGHRVSPRWRQELEFVGDPAEGPFIINLILQAVGVKPIGYCMDCGVEPEELKGVYLESVRPVVTSIEDRLEAAQPEDFPLSGGWAPYGLHARDLLLFAAELRWSDGRLPEAEALFRRALIKVFGAPRKAYLCRMLKDIVASVPYVNRTRLGPGEGWEQV